MVTVTAPHAPRTPRPFFSRRPRPVALTDLPEVAPVDQPDQPDQADRAGDAELRDADLPDDRLPDDGPAVAGPDARSAARTAAVVALSVGLLVGTMVLAALGVGEVVRAGAEWFMTR